MFGQIVIGILFIVLGVVIIYYSEAIVQTIGRNKRAENNLGGTRNAIILLGFLVIILGVLFACGLFKSVSPMDSVVSTF